MVEKTLVIIKPDGVMKEVTDEIVKRYEDAGLSLCKWKKFRFNLNKARAFYKEHEGKFYFEGLVLAMTSGPSLIILFEGEDAITTVRKLNGATDPTKADPGTIRHDFRSAGGPFNTVHGSDSAEAVMREVKIVGLLKYLK